MNQICVQCSREGIVICALLKSVMKRTAKVVSQRVSGWRDTDNGKMLVSASDGTRSVGGTHDENHP